MNQFNTINELQGQIRDLSKQSIKDKARLRSGYEKKIQNYSDKYKKVKGKADQAQAVSRLMGTTAGGLAGGTLGHYLGNKFDKNEKDKYGLESSKGRIAGTVGGSTLGMIGGNLLQKSMNNGKLSGLIKTNSAKKGITRLGLEKISAWNKSQSNIKSNFNKNTNLGSSFDKATTARHKASKKGSSFGGTLGAVAGGTAGFLAGGPMGAITGASVGSGVGKAAGNVIGGALKGPKM